MTDRDIMQQALDALQGLADYRYTERVKATMSALRERLAQPEQEPVDLSYQPDWKEEYQKAVDLHCETLDELREANAWIKNLEKLMADQDVLLERQTQGEDIAGALFDFMGWLTSRPKRIMLSSVDDASPAVDAIRDFAKMRGLSLDDARVTDWQDALAQPEQEPVAVVSGYYGGQCVILPIDPARIFNSNTPLYTAPPAQRTWVGLTDEEIEKGRDQTFSINNPYCPCDSKTMRKAVRWAEAKLREKNA